MSAGIVKLVHGCTYSSHISRLLEVQQTAANAEAMTHMLMSLRGRRQLAYHNVLPSGWQRIYAYLMVTV